MRSLGSYIRRLSPILVLLLAACLMALVVFLSSSCGTHEPAEPWNVEDAVRQEMARRAARFDPSTIVPCDAVTFEGYFDAYGKRTDIYRYERPLGKWNRNASMDCYAQGESRSECSLDGYLGVLHSCWARQDRECLERMHTYLSANDWTCGLGAESATSISPLRGLLESAIGLQSFSEDADGDDFATLTGFRGYLVASYIWLYGKVHGGINSAQLASLKVLAYGRSEEPLFQALYHKFTDGNQEIAMRKLNGFTFNPDYWPSCPEDVLYIVSAAAAFEGR